MARCSCAPSAGGCTCAYANTDSIVVSGAGTPAAPFEFDLQPEGVKPEHYEDGSVGPDALAPEAVGFEALAPEFILTARKPLPDGQATAPDVWRDVGAASDRISFPSPGRASVVEAHLRLRPTSGGLTDDQEVSIRIGCSFDGGVNFDFSEGASGTVGPEDDIDRITLNTFDLWDGVPTGAIIVKAQLMQLTGSFPSLINFEAGHMIAKVYPG